MKKFVLWALAALLFSVLASAATANVASDGAEAQARFIQYVISWFISMLSMMVSMVMVWRGKNGVAFVFAAFAVVAAAVAFAFVFAAFAAFAAAPAAFAVAFAVAAFVAVATAAVDADSGPFHVFVGGYYTLMVASMAVLLFS